MSEPRAGLETGRLPDEIDVLACVDSSPSLVIVEAMVDRLLYRIDLSREDPDARRRARASFADAVRRAVANLVTAGAVEWVRRDRSYPFDPAPRLDGSDMPAIRRRVPSAEAEAEIALALGKDPEPILAAATGRPARYRKGPCWFWRPSERAQMVVVPKPSGNHGVHVLNTQHDMGLICNRRLILMRVLNDAEERNAAWALGCHTSEVPEYLAARLERDGWAAFNPDAPPAWVAETKESVQ